MTMNEPSVFQAEAKMVRLKDELGAFFEASMEEKEAKIGQLTEELNGLRQKVVSVHKQMLQMLLVFVSNIKKF